MARGSTKKNTRSEEYVINKKHLGEEPIFNEPLTRLDYTSALNWYNYMCNSSDAKEYTIEYLNSKGRKEDAKKLKTISDTWINNTVGWTCRLLSRGYRIPIDVTEFIDKRIRETLSRATVENIESETPKVSVQDRMRERSHDIISEIEGMIDEYIYDEQEFSLYKWLQSNNIPASYASSIISKFNPVLLELIEAHKGKDDQLKEGYKHLKSSQLKRLIAFYNSLCEDAEKYANVTKKTRAPRKPRAISVDKKLKTFKYQKEDNTFKIASVNPEKIIGSQELWTFNTKYKTLTVFRALDRGGLDVKGTSIIKYSEETSFTMRTGRNPHEAIKKVIDGGKIILRKIDQELKNHAPLQSRINENTILLRVL